MQNECVLGTLKEPIAVFVEKMEKNRIQLWLQGESLRYRAPKGIVTEEILSCFRERKEELVDYLEQEASEKQFFDSIQPLQTREHYPLSSAQKRLFVTDQLSNTGVAYNMPIAVYMEGNIDALQLEEILNKLIKRHESLRTSFEMKDGEPVQIIHNQLEFKIEFYGGTNEGANTIIRKFVRPFDLNKAPLMRAGLFKMKSGKYLFIIDVHHIISDGFSINILVKEFISLCQGLELPALKIQYKDFAVWQDTQICKSFMKKQQKYWLDSLKGELPVLTLPSDYKRPSVRSVGGKTVEFNISSIIAVKINELAKKTGNTLNNVFFALYAILLHKYSGQNEIIIGSLVAGRRNADLESIIGVFMNFLPVRLFVNPDNTFIEFLDYIKNQLMSTYQNQDYPFERIIEDTGVKTDLSRNPVFDTMFIFHNEVDSAEDIEVGNYKLSAYNPLLDTSTLDIKTDIYPGTEGTLRCVIEYNTALFKTETVGKMFEHFNFLMEKAIESLEWKVSDIELFSIEDMPIIEEKRKLNATHPNKLPLAIAATFTSEPIKDYIIWLGKKFGIDIYVNFASYNQVFQELLDPHGLVSQNTGVNLLLIRFEDWIRNDSSDTKNKIVKLEKNYSDLINALQNKEKMVKYFVAVFPATSRDNAESSYIEGMYERLFNDIREIKNVETIDFRSLPEEAGISEVFDEVKDKVGHLPFSDEFYAAMALKTAETISLDFDPTIMPDRYTINELMELPIHDQSFNKNTVYKAPENNTEEKLVSIVEEILGVKGIGTEDNFFEAGGNSLKAAALVSRIYKAFHTEMPLREVFELKSVKKIAKHITYAEKSIYSSIKPVEEKVFYPLSSAQKRMFHVSKLEGVGTSYNMPGVTILEGRLDILKLKKVFENLIERHESLRTSFSFENSEPVQTINRHIEFEPQYTECEENEVMNKISEFIKPFDLEKAPLLRVVLIKITDIKHVLIFDLHHIIADGFSLSILTQEFMEQYKGVVREPLNIQYKDFAVWQNDPSVNEQFNKQKEYWLNKFSTPVPVLTLPVDYPRPAQQSFEGNIHNFIIDEELTQKLNSISLENNATLFMILLAAYYTLLFKYTQQSDITIGLPVAGRPHHDLENVIGMFANTLALRNYPSGEKTFRDFLREVRINLLEAYQNQDFQFDELVSEIKIKRDRSRNPLFDVGFGMQPNQDMGSELDGLKLIPFELEQSSTKLDLIMHVSQIQNSIQVQVEYCIKLFKKETITGLGRHFINILMGIAQNPDIKLSQIDMLSQYEKDEILVQFNKREGEDEYDF